MLFRSPKRTGHSTFKPGLFSLDGAVEGWQDYATGAVDQTLGLTQFATRPQYPFSIVPSVGVTTIAAGDRAYLMRGIVTELESPLEVGEPVGVRFALMGDTSFARGHVGAPSATRSSTLTGTAVAQAGPTATQFLYATLHVFATTGSPTLDVVIQSDDSGGFGTPTARITFAQATSAGGANWYQFSSVAGSFVSESHLRAVGTFGGTGSITYAVFFGVA